MDANCNIINKACIKDTKKKSRYDAKHRIFDSSRLENKFKRLEDRFDILDNDLTELRWEMQDIINRLSNTKSKTKHITSSDSSGSD